MMHVGIFLIGFGCLALEITLMRLLSVIAWYHLAFFVIATTMLGMTAGAVFVYLRPQRFQAHGLGEALGRSCLGFALTVPATLVALCLLPLDLRGTLMSMLALLVATAACSLPCYFAGIALNAVLAKCPLPVGRLYASDLLAASGGCLFVLGGLEILGAPSSILLCSASGCKETPQEIAHGRAGNLP